MRRKKSKKNNFKPNFFEKSAWDKNLFVCGLDEVGRGCLAGPLVVAAAILPKNCKSTLLKDSKILTKEEREKAFIWIDKHCFYSYAIASWKEIDSINIYQATLQTMQKAYLKLLSTLCFDPKLIKYVLVDAMPLQIPKEVMHEELERHYFPYGETYSKSIAAASIVAKVIRDRLMEKMHKSFPHYNLASHKGYATIHHLKAFEEHGSSIIHRKSFISGLSYSQIQEGIQKSLFDLLDSENEESQAESVNE